MIKLITIEKRIGQVREEQAAGTYTRCPRCGRDTMKLGDRLYTNALSRSADIMVCDDCGIDEAKLAYMNSPMPLWAWDCAKPNILPSDFKTRRGREVFNEIEDKYLNPLIDLFKLYTEGAAREDIRYTAFETMPGLTELWCEPFDARFNARDAVACVRVHKINGEFFASISVIPV